MINVLFEDEYLLVIDKPAGLVVHEGAGERQALLTDWLKTERPEIIVAFASETADLYFRPGIVHRLDKDTSGVMVIAKTPAIKQQLQALFKSRSVTKQYVALVLGRPEPEQGTIESFTSRNPSHRRQMAVSLAEKGKLAKTDYRVVKHYQYRIKGQKAYPLSLLSLRLHSGRMHQIRVHLKYKGWPIIGDQTYQTKPSRNVSKALGLDRQFLHAERLAFKHPVTGERIDVLSQIPSDLQRVIDEMTMVS